VRGRTQLRWTAVERKFRRCLRPLRVDGRRTGAESVLQSPDIETACPRAIGYASSDARGHSTGGHAGVAADWAPLISARRRPAAGPRQAAAARMSRVQQNFRTGGRIAAPAIRRDAAVPAARQRGAGPGSSIQRPGPISSDTDAISLSSIPWPGSARPDEQKPPARTGARGQLLEGCRVRRPTTVRRSATGQSGRGIHGRDAGCGRRGPID